MEKTQSGFTLIELMSVTAIISILATIALSVYQDYAVRTKVAEGFNLSTPVKLAVSENFMLAGKFLAPNNASYGLPANTSIASEYVNNVSVGANGVITITYATIGNFASQKTVLLTPNVANIKTVNWKCSDGTMPDLYLPASCR